MILIWDTGASFGLTQFQSNFIDYVKCDIPDKDMTKVTRVIGIGTTLHKFVDTNGQEVCLTSLCVLSSDPDQCLVANVADMSPTMSLLPTRHPFLVRHAICQDISVLSACRLLDSMHNSTRRSTRAKWSVHAWVTIFVSFIDSYQKDNAKNLRYIKQKLATCSQ